MLKANILIGVSLFEGLLLLDLLSGLHTTGSTVVWCFLHVTAVVVGTLLLYTMVSQSGCDATAHQKKNDQTSRIEGDDSLNSLKPNGGLVVLVALIGITLPGVGMGGLALAITYGLRASLARSYLPDYWQVTKVAKLPYAAPIGRKLKPVDSRGFTEHLMYSKDDDDIYRKVLSTSHVKSSLAIDTLKQAMQHHDEKVRLTAYKTLDKKVTDLNKTIQQIEKEVEADGAMNTSDKWLQIASNYWELITLEGGELVARRQLLAKAAAAAIKAVSLTPGNRNAHLVLGRVSLAQGETRRAKVALARAQALGMPADKVLPYLAECAYVERDFHKVKKLLAGIDESIVAYPPLSQVARYWA